MSRQFLDFTQSVLWTWVAMGVIATSLLLLLLLSPQLAVGQSDVSPNVPEAPGNISGVAVDANGAPLAGIGVTLYRQGLEGGWYSLREVTTNNEGAYAFGLLGVGIYRVGFRDPARRFADAYYNNATTVNGGTDILITGNIVTGVNATLQVGGAITGLITFTVETAPTSPEVRLYQREAPNTPPTGAEVPYWRDVRTLSLPLGRQVYSFTGLAAGLYRACATVNSEAGAYLFECYDNVANIQSAADLSVTLGVTLANVDLVLGDGADRGQITGVVTSLAGDPLPAISVMATTFGAQLGPSTFMTHTGVDGVYQLSSLVSGTYTLRFADPNNQYATEVYDDSPTPYRWTPVSVAPRAQVSNVNAMLAPGAQITGVVTVVGQSTANAYVSVYREGDPPGTYFVQIPTDSSTGRYSVGALPAGLYRVCGQAFSIDSGYFGCYNGFSVEGATPISLTVGATAPNINFDLTGGVRYEGRITGTVTADGAPLAGIKVSLYPQYINAVAPLVYVFTDSQGRYSIDGLAYSSYIVGFSDPNGVYGSLFFPNSPSPSTVETVNVNDGQVTANVDATLTQGGAISGRVTTNQEAPVANVRVLVYWNGVGYPERLPFTTLTDSAGQYTLGGLAPGPYRVCFSYLDTYYPVECYGAQGDTLFNATVLNVEAGQTLTGINQLWGADLSYYLPLITRVTFACDLVTEIPASECAALEAIGRNTEPFSPLDTLWFTDNSPCQWLRITCTEGHITQIDLEWLGVSALPPEIGELAQLQWLSVAGNYRLTTLPPTIGKLTGLRLLNVSNTQLRTLPGEIGALVNLEELYLSNTSLASLPPEFGNLTRLHTLSLSGALLTHLSAEIGGLTELRSLQLSGDSFTSLPPEIGNLTNLQELQLLYTGLSKLPSEIGRLTNLQTLRLNSIRPLTVPAEIGNLTSLQTLDLAYNYQSIAGLPPEIGQLRNLQTLNLSFTPLPALPAEIGELTALRELHLPGTRLTSLPATLKNLTALQILDLSFNGLAEVPVAATTPPNLQRLDLSHNAFTIAPKTLAAAKNLTWLDLSANQINTVAPEIEQLSKLELLSFSHNQLASLPATLWNMKSLRELYLFANQLTSLPREVNKLTNLRRLDISQNQLSSLPTQIGDLSKLEFLSLYSNQLTQIPAEVGKLTRLQWLYLSDNVQLSGALPTSFLNLRLQSLWVYNTSLCAPNTEEFRTWLAQIQYVAGPVPVCS